MKTLLIFLAIVLIAAGWAVGLINIFSPGTVTVGLNLDVAATLFTGGCVLLGLAVVAGNLAAMTQREPDDVAEEDYSPVAPAAPAGSDLPDFMAPASAAAAGAAAGVAAGASALGDTVEDKADAASDVVDDVLEGVKDRAEPAADTAGSVFSSVTGTVDETAEEVVDKAKEVAGDAADKVDEVAEDTVSKARDDLSSFFAKPADTSQAPEADTPPAFAAKPEPKLSPAVAEKADAEPEAKPEAKPEPPVSQKDVDDDIDSIFEDAPPAKADDSDKDATEVDKTATGTPTSDVPQAEDKKQEAAASAPEKAPDAAAEKPAVEPDTEDPPDSLPQEDELFVVEERVIRERPARLLSDGTVEAETDEGWMRFENVEHVEEYLDAMKATA